ncbi:MAG: hypothetical protein AB2598_07110 [Candidatus Thiodiazotropha sp.]
MNKIVLDDPKLQTGEDNRDYYSMVFGALKLAMREGGFASPMVKRGCNKGCDCLHNYKQRAANLDGMFSI